MTQGIYLLIKKMIMTSDADTSAKIARQNKKLPSYTTSLGKKYIMDTLDLANDYVNLSWEEFEKKHKKELLPEVLEYLSERNASRISSTCT